MHTKIHAHCLDIAGQDDHGYKQTRCAGPSSPAARQIGSQDRDIDYEAVVKLAENFNGAGKLGLDA